jgi:hypothetical protein
MENKTIKRKEYITIGSVMVGKDGSSYISVSKDVQITINGKAFTGKYISLQSPADKFKRMADKGKISADEAADKIAKIPEYIKKEVVAVLE